MGMHDLYPFALSPGARRKIEVAWRLTRRTVPPDRLDRTATSGIVAGPDPPADNHGERSGDRVAGQKGEHMRSRSRVRSMFVPLAMSECWRRKRRQRRHRHDDSRRHRRRGHRARRHRSQTRQAQRRKGGRRRRPGSRQWRRQRPRRRRPRRHDRHGDGRRGVRGRDGRDAGGARRLRRGERDEDHLHGSPRFRCADRNAGRGRCATGHRHASPAGEARRIRSER